MYQEKLRLRLESGEPKCANCAKWDRQLTEDHPMGVYGICTLITPTENDGGAQLEDFFYTTDMTVCSKWQQKD